MEREFFGIAGPCFFEYLTSRVRSLNVLLYSILRPSREYSFFFFGSVMCFEEDM